MASELRTSEAGLKLIMAYEGFRPVSKQLPDGRWVIGYGHTKAARANLRVSQEEAAAILREYDLKPVEKALTELLLVSVNQNEFDALVSFAFNIGLDQFEESEVLAHLNSGDRLKAAAAMDSWCKALVGTREMIVEPLVRRRADEKALFLKAMGTVPLASSSRFRPMANTKTAMPDETVRARSARAFDEITSSLPDETATEIAARNVRERLTRILGEEEGLRQVTEESAADSTSDEASVEEIRAAISALVAEDDDEPGEAHSSNGDFGLEEITLSGRQARTPSSDGGAFEMEEVHLSKTSHNGLPLIDDLRPAEIDPDMVRRAQLGEPQREGPVEIFLFGLISLIGAFMFAYGGAEQFGWFGIEPISHAGFAAYMPPFLMLAGGLLALIMAYYCLRAVFARDI